MEKEDWIVFQDDEYTRTPKNADPVIVVFDDGSVGTAYYNGKYWISQTAISKSVKKWRYKVTKSK